MAESSTSDINIDLVLKNLRTLQHTLPPNKILVTSVGTLGRISKQLLRYSLEPIDLRSYNTIYGIPYEVFTTVKECLDRMMEPTEKGVELELFLFEEIPDDLLTHPWVREQIKKLTRPSEALQALDSKNPLSIQITSP